MLLRLGLETEIHGEQTAVWLDFGSFDLPNSNDLNFLLLYKEAYSYPSPCCRVRRARASRVACATKIASAAMSTARPIATS